MNYYIDNLGRLIYESCNMKSEIIGVEEADDKFLFFSLQLVWE